MNLCKALIHGCVSTADGAGGLGAGGVVEKVCALLPKHCMMGSRRTYPCTASHLLVPFQRHGSFPLDAAVTDTRNSSPIPLLHSDVSAAEADET